MENRWENFWKSGKVEDYLGYCQNADACIEDSRMMGKDTGNHGAVRGDDGDGAECDAAWRVR